MVERSDTGTARPEINYQRSTNSRLCVHIPEYHKVSSVLLSAHPLSSESTRKSRGTDVHGLVTRFHANSMDSRVPGPPCGRAGSVKVPCTAVPLGARVPGRGRATTVHIVLFYVTPPPTAQGLFLRGEIGRGLILSLALDNSNQKLVQTTRSCLGSNRKRTQKKKTNSAH